MERERLIGIALVVISACGYGSGPLFAKPAYAAGVDWLTLLAWRFLFAAVLSWGWLLIWPAQRRALRNAVAPARAGAHRCSASSSSATAARTSPGSQYRERLARRR